MNISPHTPSTSPPSLNLPPGFTLVELLIATIVLAVGLLALTSTGAAIVKLERHGQRLARVAAMGETRLELLRPQLCAAAPGVSSSHGLDERWHVMRSGARTLVLVDTIERTADESAALHNAYAFRSAVRC